MLTLQFYTRPDCTLCHSALAVVHRVQKKLPFDLNVINIDEDSALRQRYDTVIPVLTCGNIDLARTFIEEKSLGLALKKLASPS